VREKPGPAIMKMLVDMYPDEGVVHEWADRIMDKRRAVINGGGEVIQYYEQKDLSSFAPDGYDGTTKIGRAYTNSILPRLPSVILNTIYKNTHMEVDIKTCFATMLTQLFKDVQTPAMDFYAGNPDRVYDRLHGSLGMDRATAKKVLNAIICSYPNVAEDPDVGNWAEIGRDDFITAFKFEVSLMAKALEDQYPGFYGMIAAKCAAENKPDHVGGTALFYAACDLEHEVMRAVMAYLLPDHDDIVWKYDGVLMSKTCLSGKTTDQWAADLNEHVKEKLTLDVQFAIKDLSPNSLGIVFGPQEIELEGANSAYRRWKGKFERRYARCSNPPSFMMFSHDAKRFIDLKKGEFEHNTMEENKAFVKEWLEDPDKRMYAFRDFLPPPCEVRTDAYNVYRGMAGEELPANDGPVDISLYLNHVRILMGSNDENAAYMHKLIAVKMQKPGLKWRVMPIIMSSQGVGKDIWFDFLATIFGEHQTLKVDGIHKLTSTNSGQLEGKLMCCLQEMGKKDTKEHEEYLKALITNDTLQLEEKYIKTRQSTNVVELIGFTNKFGAVNVSVDDRRYFVVVSDSSHANEAQYMEPLIRFFRGQHNKRAVYDYYMAMNIEGFNPSAERPITEAHKEAAEESIPLIDRFLQQTLPEWKQRAREPGSEITINDDGSMEIVTNAAIASFMDFAKQVGIRNAESKNSMTQFFGVMMRELKARLHKYAESEDRPVLGNKRTKKARYYVIETPGLEAYLAKVFQVGLEEPEPQPETDRPRRTARRQPDNRFAIKEGAEILGVVDTLEEVNKELGHAYVDTRLDEETGQHYQVLVHQVINKEIQLEREYMGVMGKIRLEAKYPFYVRDRTV
jgi:hypothetical protein